MEHLREGWPVDTSHTVYSSPLIGDLDQDGFDDVIMGSYSKVYALTSNGTQVSSWPTLYAWTSYSKPAIADIDGDGDFEIFHTGAGNVNAWHHDGTYVTGWPNGVGETYVWQSSPTIGDIDNNGDLEVLVASENGNIHIWDHDGSDFNVINVPDAYLYGFRLTPAIADIDGDGDLEIFLGNNNDTVYAWHHDGSPVEGWPVSLQAGYLIAFTSSPSIGDLDNDGDLEVVVYSPNKNTVYAWHHDGTVVTGWPASLGQYQGSPFYGWRATPAIGDVDNDGDSEVFVGHWDHKIYGFHHDGNLVSGWPKDVGDLVYSSVALADVDNDNDLEIFVGDHLGGFYGWHHSGDELPGFPKYAQDHIGPSSPAIGDLDNNGKPDIVVGSWDDNIYAFELDSVLGTENNGWPSLHHDDWNTGCYDCGIVPVCGNGEIESGEECDDSNTENGDGCSRNCVLEDNVRGVFVTSQTWDGGLGGIGGADQKCQEAAGNAGLSATYGAWISDSTLSSKDKLEHYEGRYIRLDGAIVANNWSDLTDGTLDNEINIDELGNILTSADNNGVWTGSLPDGSGSGRYCNDWVSNSQENNGTLGIFTLSSEAWTWEADAPCSFESHLYCFEVNAPDVTGWVNTYEAIFGEENEIEAFIRNIGMYPALDVEAALYKNDDFWNGTGWEDDLTLIDEVYIGGLEIDEEKYINFTWTPTETGWQSVKMIITAPDDGDLSNNEYGRSINVMLNAPDMTGWVYTSSAIVDQANNIEAQVWNLGLQDATDVEAALYKNDDFWNGTGWEDNLTLIDTVFIGTVLSDTGVEVDFTWTPTEIGYQQVKMIITAPGDGDLSNNEYNRGIDVVLDAPDMTGWVYTSSAIVDEVNNIEARVENIGLQDATDVEAALYENDDFWNGTSWEDNLTFIDEVYIGDLEPGEGKHINFTWTPTETGWQPVKMIITAPDDGDLSNNEYGRSINVMLNAPDVTGWIDTFSAIVNEANDIEALVENIGLQDATNVEATLYENDEFWNGTSWEDNLTFIDSVFVGTVASDQEVEIDFTWTPTETGYQKVKMIITAPDDGDLSNNEYDRSINVIAEGPDITGWIITGQATLGEVSEIEAELENIGSQSSSGINATLYEYEQTFNGTGWVEDLTYIDQTSIGSLSPGEDAMISFFWTPTETGWQSVKMIIESPGDINPYNNDISRGIDVVIDGADAQGSFRVIDDFPAVGVETSVRIDVSNNGNQDCQNVIARLYEMPPSGGQNLLWEENIGTLAPSAWNPYTAYWTPGELGEHVIQLEITSDNDVFPENDIYNETIEVFSSVDVTLNVEEIPGFEIIGGYGTYGDIEEDFMIPNGTIDLTLPDIDLDILIGYLQETGYHNDRIIATFFRNSDLNPVMNVNADVLYGTQEYGGIVLYSRYAIVPDWDYGDETVIYLIENLDDLGITYDPELSLYTCSSWNLAFENCNSGWLAIETIADPEGDGRVFFYGEGGHVEAFALGKAAEHNVISSCQELNESGTYTLAQDIQATGTCFTITADDVVLDGDGKTITGDGTGTGVDVDGFDNLVIENLNVVSFNMGVDLVSSENSILRNNYLANNGFGINIVTSSSNTINDNTFFSNSDSGVFLRLSMDNNFVDNVFDSNGHGLRFTDGYVLRNTISGGEISGSTESAIVFDYSTNNSIINVAITNTNPSYYDIKFATQVDGARLIDMPHIGRYLFNDAVVIFEDTEHGVIEFLDGITGTGEDLSSDVWIENNVATVESTVDAGMKQSAEVTLRGVEGINSPAVYKDGVACGGDCTLLDSTGPDYKFVVADWTSYWIGESCRTEASPCTVQNISCCSGLVEVPHSSPGEAGQCIGATCGSICRPCGNDVCDDTENYCNCPEDCEQICTADAKQCPDGSTVGRDPENNCEFYECPAGSGEAVIVEREPEPIQPDRVLRRPPGLVRKSPLEVYWFCDTVDWC